MSKEAVFLVGSSVRGSKKEHRFVWMINCKLLLSVQYSWKYFVNMTGAGNNNATLYTPSLVYRSRMCRFLLNGGLDTKTRFKWFPLSAKILFWWHSLMEEVLMVSIRYYKSSALHVPSRMTRSSKRLPNIMFQRVQTVQYHIKCCWRRFIKVIYTRLHLRGINGHKIWFISKVVVFLLIDFET